MGGRAKRLRDGDAFVIKGGFDGFCVVWGQDRQISTNRLIVLDHQDHWLTVCIFGNARDTNDISRTKVEVKQSFSDEFILSFH